MAHPAPILDAEPLGARADSGRTRYELEEGYRIGRVRAARQMKRETRSLPTDCPYTWDDILNRPYELDTDR